MPVTMQHHSLYILEEAGKSHVSFQHWKGNRKGFLFVCFCLLCYTFFGVGSDRKCSHEFRFCKQIGLNSNSDHAVCSVAIPTFLNLSKLPHLHLVNGDNKNTYCLNLRSLLQEMIQLKLLAKCQILSKCELWQWLSLSSSILLLPPVLL